AQPLPVINGVTKVTATASASSKVVNVGDDCTLSFTANNCGTNNVTNVKIMIDNIVYARSGSLPAGQSATYRVNLPISGPVSFQPVICYTEPDGNEIAQKLNTISISCPSNDLAISVQASTTNPGPYEDVLFHLTLTNNGNDVIQRVQLYDCDHQPIGGPLDALYPRQVVEADLEAPIHLATNVVFYVEALESGGRVAAQSNMIKIIPSIR
ncbi:MAG: hypothetical protein Q4E65_02690, partial [Clostridia bacterium]|nr:hypothetical protein [Clostridia bacterium]